MKTVIDLLAMVAGVPRQVIESAAAQVQGGIRVRLGFYRGWPDDWRGSVAELTKYYGWGPCDAWDLPLSRLVWWREEMRRMMEAGLFNG